MVSHVFNLIWVYVLAMQQHTSLPDPHTGMQSLMEYGGQD